MNIKFFLTIFRNLRKNPGLSIMNTFALFIGILCFMIIFYYFISEMSYDRYNKNGKNIYRVATKMYKDGELQNHWATSPIKMGETMKEEFPEVTLNTKSCRLIESTLICYKEQSLRSNKIGYVDSSFLEMFTLPMLEGNPKTALRNPNSVVITKTYAKKLFGNENPMGKIIEFKNDKRPSFNVMVTGVIEDFPKNSHLDFEVLVNFQNYVNMFTNWVTNWPLHTAFTYISVKPGTDVKKLEDKISIIVDKYLADFGKKMGRKYEYYLQPLYKIHLYSHLTFDTNNGSATNVYLLLIAGIFIFIISWINYVNLIIAQSLERAKEIAIRKFAGSSKLQVIKMVIIEIFMFTLLPILLAICAYIIIQPSMMQLTGSSLNNYFSIIFWTATLLIIIATTFISSLYPAFIISSYKPIMVLKGRIARKGMGMKFRKVLTSFQFVSAGLLIIVIILINRQIKLIQNTDIGVDISNVVVVDAPILENDSIFFTKCKIFKDELEKYPAVEWVSSSASVPGKDMIKWIYKLKNQDDIEKASYPTCEIDFDYFNIYNPKFLAGRNFSLSYGADKQNAIISKSALKMLGLKTPEEAIGKLLDAGNDKEIVGVIDDYHHLSLKNEYQPIIYFYNPGRFTLSSIKLSNGNYKDAIPLIEKKWKEIFPGNPLSYAILKDSYYNQYKSDYIFGKLFLIFTLISIMISCIGLFSLSYYDTSLRLKEVAIRKILGSSIINLFGVLSKDIMKMSVISLCIACIIGYYITNLWLQNFQFHTKITTDIFIIPCLILIVINIITISYNIFNVATINPAEIIKDE